MIDIPSPAVAFVGRHNSGKTTLIEKVIAGLVARGYDVGSIKHHSHRGFDIDYPGKDSYRHRAAGASETVIAAPGMVARMTDVEGEVECSTLVKSMPNHDIVVVEGYRKSGLPTIEIMRSGNPADSRVAALFAHAAQEGLPLSTDFTQLSRVMQQQGEGEGGAGAGAEVSTGAGAGAEVSTGAGAGAEVSTGAGNVTLRDVSQNAPEESLFSAHADAASKMPSDQTVAVVSDIPEALEAARTYGIAALPLNDTEAVVDFVAATYVRPRITVVIQAGGESKRMGQSKATVPFSGRPLICRMVERLAPAADELIITTNEADRLAFLKDEFPSLSIRLIPDEYNERGALPGLYTALKAATNSYVAVVACDMVFASPRLVVAEAIALHKHAADIVVPYNKHGYEPLHAVYRKETCIGPVKQRVDEGNKRVQSFFEDESLELFRFTHEMVAEVEPRGGCFVNVNTPDELNHILRSFGD